VEKHVYFFGKNDVDGNRNMRDTLGGKGANLAEMSSIGVPVPPGFTVSTDVCNLYLSSGNTIPDEVHKEILTNLSKLENAAGQKFGDESDPLLVSVRSGSKFSMPGMMDTILNLGLNDTTVESLAHKSGNRRFALDCYRRLIHMFGDVVLSVSKKDFEKILKTYKNAVGVVNDFDLTDKHLEEIVSEFKALVKKETGKDFPQDVREQLFMSISAVFGSWNTERAITYRRLNHIPDDLGTAVNVQLMIFGNFGETSATGVGFTRDPANGSKVLY